MVTSTINCTCTFTGTTDITLNLADTQVYNVFDLTTHLNSQLSSGLHFADISFTDTGTPSTSYHTIKVKTVDGRVFKNDIYDVYNPNLDDVLYQSNSSNDLFTLFEIRNIVNWRLIVIYFIRAFQCNSGHFTVSVS